jgi:hypothetical protein
MLIKVEVFINYLFTSLLEGKMKFHFISAVLNFLENPKTDSFLLIARFSKDSYALVESELEVLKPILLENMHSHSGYKNAILTLISETLSDYKYTFQDKNNNIVQSSLIFSLLKTLPKACISSMIDFICEKELINIFSRPQIYSSSFIFSTLVHQLLEKSYDEIALKATIHFDNKALLFAQDCTGLTPIEIAMQNNCILSQEYISKAKQIIELIGMDLN